MDPQLFNQQTVDAMKTLIPHHQLLGDINRVQGIIESLFQSRSAFNSDDDKDFKKTVDQFLMFYDSQIKLVLI